MPGATRASTIPLDIASNIVGYLPLGIILGALGPLRAIVIAGLISSDVEARQLVIDAPRPLVHGRPVQRRRRCRPQSALEGALGDPTTWCSTGQTMPTLATRWRYAWPAASRSAPDQVQLASEPPTP